MYLQHFGLKFSPFTCQPNPGVFFTQAGRKNILQALHHDLEQNQPTLLLVGAEGAGKTVFCQLIRHRFNRDPYTVTYTVIYLNNPVGSFEELLRRICGQLGTPLTVDTEQDVVTVLKTLLKKQKEQGQRLLLLIDEAERMFLAALERMFRLLNELHDTYQVQTVFTGRPDFNVSMKQLGDYCEDIRIASTYALEPLSERETATYLAYRLKAAGDTRGENNPVFSEKAVQEITHLTHLGHLGQALPGIIDEIAEVALKNAAKAGADTVLVSHVALPGDHTVVSGSGIDEPTTKKRRKGLLFLFFLILLTLLFFIRPSFFANQKETFLQIVQNFTTERSIREPEKDQASLPFVVEKVETDGTLPAPLPVPVPQQPNAEKKENDRGAKKVVNAVKIIKVIQAAETTKKQATQAVSSSKVNRNPLKTAKKLPVIHSASIIELKPSMKKTRPSDFKDAPPEKENKTETKTETTAPPQQKILVPVASAQGIVIRPAAEGVVVRPASQRVVRPAVTKPAPASEPKLIQPLPTITPPSRADKADTLFAQYLQAGNRWTNKTYKDKFTVQLLVLSSDDVMKKIKDMIVREEYQEYKDTLHILRRNTVPPTLFVCYGVYNSIDEAKNAKDAMPLFLRKHHPYALPITDVLAKAKN
ncbi:Type II secretory pathway, component ExeA (putative ATPase) [Candidatus Electrothrix gigas]